MRHQEFIMPRSVSRSSLCLILFQERAQGEGESFYVLICSLFVPCAQLWCTLYGLTPGSYDLYYYQVRNITIYVLSAGWNESARVEAFEKFEEEGGKCCLFLIRNLGFIYQL